MVPPGTGICHQVNLEYLSRVVFATDDGRAYCDTLVGTDSHTTMVNGLGVLGWGVGGIEAEAAMLGPAAVHAAAAGGRLPADRGACRPGTTATDLVLTITHLLRQHGVVGKFVEFFGPGVAAVPLANRATIGNMSPEYGATCAIFPIDQVTLDYLRFTGRDEAHVDLVEAYAKEQGMFHARRRGRAGLLRDHRARPVHRRAQHRRTVPAPGPGRPGRRRSGLPATARPRPAIGTGHTGRWIDGQSIEDGDVVVAAITSCTNTSNPQVMVAAGLLAKRAVDRGLRAEAVGQDDPGPRARGWSWTTSTGPVSPSRWPEIGFDLVGFGCTTCIGNSGPLLPGVSEAVHAGDLSVASVLSGNRNFEGRIHPEVRMNYLASPPLVVAYALAGTMDIDLTTDPLGTGVGRPAGLPGRPVADAPTRSPRPSGPRSPRRCSASATARSSTATSGGRRWRPPPGDTFELGPATPPTSSARASSRVWP